MRVIKEIQNPATKITIFSWNGKYLIKLEQDMLEQTYKIDELDLMSEADLDTIINEDFIKNAVLRFRDMNKDLDEAMKDI